MNKVRTATMSNDTAYLNDTTTTDGDGLLDAPQFEQVYVTKVFVLSTTFIISIIGNTLVVIQLFRLRGPRSTIQNLILNLSIADLMVAFFNILTDIIWSSTLEWLAGNAMCKIVKYLTVFGLHLSTYITVVIAMDRCFAILSPMSRSKAPLRVRVMIILSWTLSAVFSIPQALIFEKQKYLFKQGEFHQCRIHYTAPWQQQVYLASSFILIFLIPLIIMITAYALIIYTIVKTSKEFKDTPSSPAVSKTGSDGMNHGQMRSHLFEKARKKSLRMSTVIVAAFVICWTPYYIIFLGFAFFNWEFSRKVLYFFILGTSNCMVNPLIYGAFAIYKVHKRRPLSGRRDSPNTTRMVIFKNKQWSTVSQAATSDQNSSHAKEDNRDWRCSQCGGTLVKCKQKGTESNTFKSVTWKD